MKGILGAAGTAYFKPGDFTVSQIIVACDQALWSRVGLKESEKKE